MSSSNSPCAACKCLRRKCTQECVFAPYFPPDNPQKFTTVHKVFGASNVSKLLNELNAGQREDAVNSLAYEAEYRLRDPVYGCVGLISVLQQRLRQVQVDLENAKKELSTYIGPSAMQPILSHPGFYGNYAAAAAAAYQVVPYNTMPTGIMLPPPPPQQQQQQQFVEQLAATAAREQEEIMLSYEQNNDIMRFNGGFDERGGGPVTATGFNECGGTMQQQQPSLALGSSYEAIPYQQAHQNHLHLQQELLQQPKGEAVEEEKEMSNCPLPPPC
ncbi:LOB domain-containing protein 36 isoform X2 [Salvia divinorum]|uniref:LOB domain-containing protein 36 isoform X2 n=1 Tax=Salvia divinorum TaxID=28513 RepID=A0ABD1FXD6_SALDI